TISMFQLHTIYSRFQLTLHSMSFFINDTATSEIYTLSLHDALPISGSQNVRDDAGEAGRRSDPHGERRAGTDGDPTLTMRIGARSEEHTSELQSRGHLVCRLLLEKKKITLKRTQIVSG